MTKLADFAPMPNRGHHILQVATIADVVVHVVGGNQWHSRFVRCSQQSSNMKFVVAAKMAFGDGVAAVPKNISISPECFANMSSNSTRQNTSQQAFVIFSDIIERQKTLALRRAATADGE